MKRPAFDAPVVTIRELERTRRWLRYSVACLLTLGALLVGAALILLHSLDRPWPKRRLQELARGSAGIDIDYGAVRIDLLSGVEIDGLRVRAPTEVRAFAPDLARVGRVNARWSLGAWLFGRGPVLRRLAVSDLALTVVVDERGRTSFDALARPGPTSAPAPTPLSQQASKLLGTALPIGEVDIERVTLTAIRTLRGELFDRTELQGFSMTLGASKAAPPATGARVMANLGSHAAPLELRLSREHVGAQATAARAKLWLAVDATASALTAVLDLRMVEQTFAASVSADHWLHAEASVRFDPKAGRTEIRLDHAEAGDQAVLAEASIELPDTGGPIVRHARGEIDLARLLRWLPEDLVPVTAERARARWQIESLVAGPVVRLAEGGVVAVDADLSNVALRVPAAQLQFASGELRLRAQPAKGGGIAARGSMKLASMQVVTSGERLAADGLAVELEGEQAPGGVIGGRVRLRFARAERAGVSSVAARDAEVALQVDALLPDGGAPIATRGDLAVSVALAALEARSPAAHVKVGGLALHAHTNLTGHPPYAFELDAGASRLGVSGGDGKLLVSTKARLQARASELQPDILHPAASRGVIHAAVDLGELRASLDATKGADAVDFALRATAQSLKTARPFLSTDLIDAAPWDRIAVALRSSGHVDHLLGRNPTIRATTELAVERPAFAHVAARSLTLTLASQGTVLKHEADLDVRTEALTYDGLDPSDDHLTLSVSVDREQRSVRFLLTGAGRAAAKVSASLSFDGSQRAIAYVMDADLAGLAPLAPFAAKLHGLDAFDLSQLELGLSARGTLFGVVAAVARDGSVELAPNPTRTAAIEGTADLRVAHLRWAKGDTAVVAPGLAWHSDMHAGERRSVESRLEIGTLHVDLGSRDIDLNGVREDASIALSGSLADPEIELSQRLAVRAVEQTFVPEYPMGNLVFVLSAERGPESVVHITDMKVANGDGGTALALTGNLDFGEGRRTLSVTATLDQDLVRLSTIPERMKGRGKLTVEANVTSPDLALYRVRAALEGENVSFTLARAGIEVDTANGEVPIAVTLEASRNGVRFERSEKRNPYSMLRFADQHPLLSRSGFVSIARLKTPFVSIAPLVGNLAIEQNVISLSQFEMGVRGGSITGQCGIDWDGPRSTLELHVRASGVQSSHGEPFDGNIAVAISASDRTIDGRAEVLRIGERHLLDLLDLQDPLHVDPAMNRIRTALGFGYPKHLRLVFDHGFASARLELGGLASLVSISELRGIPMGPIVDKMLAPMLDGSALKEMP
ncbi:MAG: hypothetical protein ACHQ53_07945 [Polyangiales bacterium]